MAKHLNHSPLPIAWLITFECLLTFDIVLMKSYESMFNSIENIKIVCKYIFFLLLYCLQSNIIYTGEISFPFLYLWPGAIRQTCWVPYLLSLPLHILNLIFLAASLSSENHNSLERGGLMYGVCASSVTINTYNKHIYTQ